ncbi:MAG: hypothetical protein BWY64_02729 [bacterium ADurb.Bin363]|nr:MAG: hypothetical protein BWY64_02729 [bacterium ADurb.Bin363]
MGVSYISKTDGTEIEYFEYNPICTIYPRNDTVVFSFLSMPAHTTDATPRIIKPQPSFLNFGANQKGGKLSASHHYMTEKKFKGFKNKYYADPPEDYYLYDDKTGNIYQVIWLSFFPDYHPGTYNVPWTMDFIIRDIILEP